MEHDGSADKPPAVGADLIPNPVSVEPETSQLLPGNHSVLRGR
jgi:hypothetical protein